MQPYLDQSTRRDNAIDTPLQKADHDDLDNLKINLFEPRALLQKSIPHKSGLLDTEIEKFSLRPSKTHHLHNSP